MERKIKIFDTTLRDGEQAPGYGMNIAEKILMAGQLDSLGVDVLEAGFAAASQGDFQAVKSISAVVKHAVVASIARASKHDIDLAYEAVKGAEKPRLHIFLATSDIHMRYKLKKTREEVLALAAESVAYAKTLCEDVEFSAEDASRSDREFLCKVYSAAIRAGATTINITDTVGYAEPDEFGNLVRYVVEHVEGIEKADVSVHCHDDLGMATANSLSAIKNGATQVECTVNGIGERAGNAALEEIVMALRTRRELFGADCGVETTRIFGVSRLLSSITGVKVQPNKAIVGENAFAHEAGIHQHGMLEHAATYEIITPASVGVSEDKIVLGKHSGKHALADRLKILGLSVSEEQFERVFEEFKRLADRQKNVPDKDIAAIVRRSTICVPERYKLDQFVINVGGIDNETETSSSVTLVCPDGKKRSAIVSSQFGAIDASYKAIGEIVGGQDRELVDFTLDSVTSGTDAQCEVTVKIKAGGNVYNGHAVELDILNAAVQACLSGINNMLYEQSIMEKESE